MVACTARGLVSRAETACQLLYLAPIRGYGAAIKRGASEEDYLEDLALHLRSIASDLTDSE